MREVDEAAERVTRAMRALDAHRHDSAPTLERDYRRALEAYFVAAQEALGVAAQDDASDEDVERSHELRAAQSSIDGHYAAARRALRLARAYRLETDSSGRREHECIAAVQRHREAVRAMRMIARPPAEQLPLPGLAKTRPGARPMEEPMEKKETRRPSKVG